MTVIDFSVLEQLDTKLQDEFAIPCLFPNCNNSAEYYAVMYPQYKCNKCGLDIEFICTVHKLHYLAEWTTDFGGMRCTACGCYYAVVYRFCDLFIRIEKI